MKLFSLSQICHSSLNMYLLQRKLPFWTEKRSGTRCPSSQTIRCCQCSGAHVTGKNRVEGIQFGPLKVCPGSVTVRGACHIEFTRTDSSILHMMTRSQPLELRSLPFITDMHCLLRRVNSKQGASVKTTHKVNQAQKELCLHQDPPESPPSPGRARRQHDR